MIRRTLLGLLVLFSVPNPAFALDEEHAVFNRIEFIEERSGKKEKTNAWSHKIKIINDARSPVQIVRAELHNIGKPYFGTYSKVPAYIIRITSKGPNVSMLEYGVLRYDSFRDYDGGENLISTVFKENVLTEWYSYQKLSPSFRGFGTGCVFVRNVRLSDGRIWKMFTAHIAREMREAKCGTKNLKEQEKHIKEKRKPVQ